MEIAKKETAKIRGYILRNGYNMFGSVDGSLVVFLSLEKALKAKETREADLGSLDSNNYLMIEEVEIPIEGKEDNIKRVLKRLESEVTK